MPKTSGRLIVPNADWKRTTTLTRTSHNASYLGLGALEVALFRGGNHPGWLLFDGPKQHDLSQSDFDAYTDSHALLAAKYPQRVPSSVLGC